MSKQSKRSKVGKSRLSDKNKEKAEEEVVVTTPDPTQSVKEKAPDSAARLSSADP